MPPLANLDAFSRWGRASLFLWYHTCLCHKSWYHGSKPGGSCNFRIAGALPIQSIAAAEVDPIFALIAAHQKAYEDLNAAENAHSAVEQELQAAGDLFPSVTSSGCRAQYQKYTPISIDTLPPTYIPKTTNGSMMNCMRPSLVARPSARRLRMPWMSPGTRNG